MPPRPRVFPVPGGRYSNDWGGARSAGATQGTGRHQGIDIFAPRGTPVYAIESGVVSKMGWNTYGGNRVWIGGRFYYAHLDKYAPGLKVGAKVKAGQLIGYVGNTGDAKNTDPHLHLGYSPDASQGARWANPYSLLQQVEKSGGKPVNPHATQQPRPTAVPAGQPDPGTVAATVTAQPELGDTSTPLTAGGLGPPGSADPSSTPDFQPVETWQLFAALPMSSPDTARFAQLAAMSQGG